MTRKTDKDMHAFRDYLERESESSLRHELHKEEAIALAGSSDIENEIVLNAAFLLRNHFVGMGKVYAQNVKLEVIPYIFYTYPDVMYCADERDKDKKHCKNFPSVLVEVVSEKNDYHARGIKLKNYLQMTSLQHYLIVSSNVKLIELYTRQADDNWLYKSYSDGNIVLLSKNISLDEFYLGVGTEIG